MATKKTKRRAAAKVAALPLPEVDPRNVDSPDAPTEPVTYDIVPMIGPNVDGLRDEMRLAHAATEEDQAAIVTEIVNSRVTPATE